MYTEKNVSCIFNMSCKFYLNTNNLKYAIYHHENVDILKEYSFVLFLQTWVNTMPPMVFQTYKTF